MESMDKRKQENYYQPSSDGWDGTVNTAGAVASLCAPSAQKRADD